MNAQQQVMDISNTMTIKEAASVWDNPRADFLEKRRGNVRLAAGGDIPRPHHEISNGLTGETSQSMVDVELRALTVLLKDVGLSL